MPQLSNVERRLLDHAAGVNWHALPVPARDAARAFLADTLAVGIAGHRAAFARDVQAAATAWSGACEGDAFVLGSAGHHLPAPAAAFVNAFQIHAQEFDCVHEPAVAHPLATVCAALLAEAGRTPGHGADFLAAMVAGVDVIATLGVAARGKLKFFRPATAGIFGSVAALVRLRGLDPATASAALGHALGFAGGTMQTHVEGKPTLALQVAAAARSAIEAVDLARAGIPAPGAALSGDFGYFALFEDDVAIAPALERLGQDWRITEVSWKPFPTGRAAHGAIVALQTAIDQHGITAQTLDRFVYHAPPLIQRLVGRPARPGMTVAYARLCFPWLGALLLDRGGINLDDFTPECLADPALLALSERFKVVADNKRDQAAFGPAIAQISRRDGAAFDIRVDRQFGAPGWPLSAEQQIAKAQACCAFGGIGANRATALFATVAALDTIPDVAAALATVTLRHKDQA